MIQPVIRAALLDNTSVYSTVGERIYDLVFPRIDSPLPAIILQRISETTDSVNLGHATVLQIDSYARNHSLAATLDRQVKIALMNRSEDAVQLAIHNIIPINTTDFYDADSRTYRVSTDYTIFWTIIPEQNESSEGAYRLNIDNLN